MRGASDFVGLQSCHVETSSNGSGRAAVDIGDGEGEGGNEGWWQEGPCISMLWRVYGLEGARGGVLKKKDGATRETVTAILRRCHPTENKMRI